MKEIATQPCGEGGGRVPGWPGLPHQGFPSRARKWASKTRNGLSKPAGRRTSGSFAHAKANAGSEGRTTRGCSLNRGVVLEVKFKSQCKNMLEFQALQGFARLSQSTIRKVCEEMKWTISASPTGADEDHHLAVVGMLNLEVVQRILHRQETEKLTLELPFPFLCHVRPSQLLVPLV